MRRDAAVRRDALIAAAAACFAERGYNVPLEEVAIRAGVGRGTLYRNFRDRRALALAIFSAEIDRIAEVVARGHDLHRSMIDLALMGARGTGLFARIGADLVVDTTTMIAVEALGTRLAAVLDPLAQRGQQCGELRSDVDGAKLGLALRMISSLVPELRVDGGATDVLHEALTLMIEGMKPR